MSNFSPKSVSALTEKVKSLSSAMDNLDPSSDAWIELNRQLQIYKERLDDINDLESPDIDEGLNDILIAMNGISASADGLVNSLNGIFEGDSVLESFGSFLIDLASLMVQFGTLLVAFGIAEEAFKAGGVGTKIAAGIAMAGLAIKIGASISNINSAGGGGVSSSSSPTTYAGANYAFDREIVLVAKGEDLVAVLGKQTAKNGGLYSGV